MKSGIHPEHAVTQVSCTCGNTFSVLSNRESLSVDICSACHPFYTGTQKFVDTAGRVEAFTKRFQWKDDSLVKEVGKKPVVRTPKKQAKDLKTELEKRKVFGKKKIIPELEREGRREGR